MKWPRSKQTGRRRTDGSPQAPSRWNTRRWRAPPAPQHADHAHRIAPPPLDDAYPTPIDAQVTTCLVLGIRAAKLVADTGEGKTFTHRDVLHVDMTIRGMVALGCAPAQGYERGYGRG